MEITFKINDAFLLGIAVNFVTIAIQAVIAKARKSSKKRH
jgi:hypothetical protein